MAQEKVTFRQLRAEEESQGYQVICDTVAWLRAKNISLWNDPLPRETYAGRHTRGQNYGLFIEDKIAVILSLTPGVPDYWPSDVDDPKATWLRTMATADPFRGRNMGLRALEEARRFLAAKGEKVLYLDCKPGFLETFYKKAGFSPVATRELLIPHASTSGPFTATLMRCSLDANL